MSRVTLTRAGGYDPSFGPRDPANQDPTLEPRLTVAQVEALAVLYEGPAERTTARTGGGKVNRQAVLALCRADLARRIADRTFAITAAGIEAHERLRERGTVARCESGSPSSPSCASAPSPSPTHPSPSTTPGS